jgi:hypothetical protein
MLLFETSGSFDHTDKFLKAMSNPDFMGRLEALGQIGVDALAAATPVRSGLTASSWSFEVTKSGNTYHLRWINTHTHNGVPIAILIQYGHGTGTGGYIQGYDYINPAMRSVFETIAFSIWQEVTSA